MLTPRGLHRHRLRAAQRLHRPPRARADEHRPFLRGVGQPPGDQGGETGYVTGEFDQSAVEADRALGRPDQQGPGAVDQGAGAGGGAGAGAGRGGPQQRVEHGRIAVGLLLEIQQDLQQLLPQRPGGGAPGCGEHSGERSAYRRRDGAVPQQPGHQGQQQGAGGGAALQSPVDVRGRVHGVVRVAVDVGAHQPGGVQGERGGVDPGQ